MEKRALSGHRGVHIRLQREPQVTLTSASRSSWQHSNKKPEDRLDYTQKASVTSCFGLGFFLYLLNTLILKMAIEPEDKVEGGEII